MPLSLGGKLFGGRSAYRLDFGFQPCRSKFVSQ